MTTVTVLDLPTTLGPARAHLHRTAGATTASGTVLLGHGAGGGLDAVDLIAVTQALVGQGWIVAGVEQPWRVAGRKIAPAPARLDQAWLEIVPQLLPHAQGPLVLGGRSAGARVAVRCATQLQAAAVVALAFPLHPPGKPERSRAAELEQAGVPVLVVNGTRDPFGTAQELSELALPGLSVVEAPGDHSLKADPGAVAQAVLAFLATALA